MTKILNKKKKLSVLIFGFMTLVTILAGAYLYLNPFGWFDTRNKASTGEFTIPQLVEVDGEFITLNGERFFPHTVYRRIPSDKPFIEKMQQYGFNTIRTYPGDPECYTNMPEDMLLIYYAGSTMADVEDEIKNYQKPIIFEAMDEVNFRNEEGVQEYRAFVDEYESLGVQTLRYLNFGPCSYLNPPYDFTDALETCGDFDNFPKELIQLSDIVSFDIYPAFGWRIDIFNEDPNISREQQDLLAVGRYVDELDKLGAENKPKWMILQATSREEQEYFECCRDNYGWDCKYPNRNDACDCGEECSFDRERAINTRSTVEEMEFMFYQSIVHGATGVIWFGGEDYWYDDLEDVWWNDLESIAQNVPYEVLTKDNEENTFNLESSATNYYGEKALNYIVKRRSNELWIIGVNESLENSQGTFRLMDTANSGPILAADTYLSSPSEGENDVIKSFSQDKLEVEVNAAAPFILKVSVCEKSCDGKECGDDGCGGSCGSCDSGETCTDGSCVVDCTPSCESKECGDDGCGGSCGECGEGDICNESGQCEVKSQECAAYYVGYDFDESVSECERQTYVGCDDPFDYTTLQECEEANGLNDCTPNCSTKECGDDGCGGSCGECESSESCENGECKQPSWTCTAEFIGYVYDDGTQECRQDSATGCSSPFEYDTLEECENAYGLNQCSPDCNGKECGDDGCGGSCGSCGAGYICENNLCVSSNPNQGSDNGESGDDDGEISPMPKEEISSLPDTASDEVSVIILGSAFLLLGIMFYKIGFLDSTLNWIFDVSGKFKEKIRFELSEERRLSRWENRFVKEIKNKSSKVDDKNNR
jgi:hypothetical protein